jgi:copper chaperone
MRLDVDGMTCGHCERAIAAAVARLGGQARVDRAAGTVEVDGPVDPDAVRKAIEEEGYTVLSPSLQPASPGDRDG